MNNIHHTPLSPIHNIIPTHNILPVPPTPKKGYKEYYIHEKKEWVQIKNTQIKSAM
jgi:hypothetical protein